MSWWQGLQIPFELGVLAVYSGGLLVTARIFEALGRYHFRRAQRYGEMGFTYHAYEDHYKCHQGEILSRRAHDSHRRVALYQAPAHACNQCHCKHACTPHDEGRRVYRSLAAWAETDLARFHQGLSVLIYLAGLSLVVIAAMHWQKPPELTLLAIIAAGHGTSLWIEWRRRPRVEDPFSPVTPPVTLTVGGQPPPAASSAPLADSSMV